MQNREAMHRHPKSASALLAEAPGVDVNFGDVDEQAAALTGWNQSYMQLEAGGFRGGMRQFELDGVRVFSERLNTSVFQTGALSSGRLALGVPLQCSEPSLFCGQHCHRDSLHVFSGRSGFEFRTAGEHIMLGMELSPTLTSAVLAEDDGSAHFNGEAGIHLAAPKALAELRQFLVLLFDAVRATPDLLAVPAVRAGMLDALLERIVSLQAKAVQPHERNQGHWLLVREAQRLANEQVAQPPSIADLCANLGTSRRTLQSGFQQILGMSPLTYLRVVRLSAARKSLKSANSVTDAATALGFWHFGHFAKDYQELFGELPSQTLRRSRSGKVRTGD